MTLPGATVFRMMVGMGRHGTDPQWNGERRRPAAQIRHSISDNLEVELRAGFVRHEVKAKSETRKLIQHSFVGLLDCQCDVVLSPASQQRLVLFRPTPGSGTAEKLDMLGVLGTQEFSTTG